MKSLWVLIIVLACQNVQDETNKFERSELNVKSLSAHCFYALDDKYNAGGINSQIENWKKEKSADILAGEVEGDLFLRNGGGPNGAEWNPSADLYLAIHSSQDYQIWLNDTLWPTQKMEGKEIDWYHLPSGIWAEKLIEISDKEAIAMFPFLEQDDDSPIETLDPTLGEILKFTFKSANYSTTHYFHASFGE